MSDRFSWHIEAVLPPEGERKWSKNIQVKVFTVTLEQATEAVRERYPTAVFIKVLRDRLTDNVIIVEPAHNPPASREEV